jgi:inosine-uridine nucleoside N-ribohydrolase
MKAKKVIIDCDPGQDDAINLLLAMSSPDAFSILGITAVAGNVPLDLTQRNARIICEVANRADVDVFAGCSRPMVRELVTAENVHGKTGIDGVDIFEPVHPLRSQHAVDFIVDTLHAEEDGSVTLVPTGPLTNIATAFASDPSIVPKVEQIVLMGGAMREAGNHSPSAEFNILVDPQAAAAVFECGRPLTVLGLDVTHQALATRERVARIRAVGTEAATAAANMLDFFNRHDTEKYDSLGSPLHDPCTIAYLLEPGLFTSKQCNISIETQSELTMGNTAVDFWHVTDKPRNANWVYGIDADGFYELLTERLARF